MSDEMKLAWHAASEKIAAEFASEQPPASVPDADPPATWDQWLLQWHDDGGK